MVAICSPSPIRSDRSSGDYEKLYARSDYPTMLNRINARERILENIRRPEIIISKALMSILHCKGH